MYDGIIVHYNEIATKGKNRAFFENKLLTNINLAFNKEHKIYRKYGLIYINLNENYNFEKTKQILKKIPGIAHFSFIKKASLDFENVKEKTFFFLKSINFKTFKVETKRNNKNYKYKSPDINAMLGEYIFKNLNKKVDVKNPDLIYYLEVCEKEIYMYFEKIKGIGGLPVGTGGKVICSLSGGIDSPVSAYLFMKRGFFVNFVHIYNNTLVKTQVLDKIKKLVEKLSKYQPNTKLYIIPFSEIQKQIIANVQSDYRMLIYRRYMFKIINEIAIKEKAKGIVTGDNLGQVASQTIENITSIYSASKLPIFSPLIAFDKNEIIKIAKEINTFNISIEPYPDCCSYMLSKHPKTSSTIDEVIALEKNIKNTPKFIAQAIEKGDLFSYSKK